MLGPKRLDLAHVLGPDARPRRLARAHDAERERVGDELELGAPVPAGAVPTPPRRDGDADVVPGDARVRQVVLQDDRHRSRRAASAAFVRGGVRRDHHPVVRGGVGGRREGPVGGAESGAHAEPAELAAGALLHANLLDVADDRTPGVHRGETRPDAGFGGFLDRGALLLQKLGGRARGRALGGSLALALGADDEAVAARVAREELLHLLGLDRARADDRAGEGEESAGVPGAHARDRGGGAGARQALEVDADADASLDAHRAMELARLARGRLLERGQRPGLRGDRGEVEQGRDGARAREEGVHEAGHRGRQPERVHVQAHAVVIAARERVAKVARVVLEEVRLERRAERVVADRRRRHARGRPRARRARGRDARAARARRGTTRAPDRRDDPSAPRRVR